MEGNHNKAWSLINDVFPINPESSSLSHSFLIQDHQKVNELIQYLPSIKSKEEVDFIMNVLIDNFTELRMNAASFVLLSSEDIYHLLFNLFLSFEGRPPLSILYLLELLLMYGFTEKFSLAWLFDEISAKIRKEEASSIYLSNFFGVIKYFYGYRKNNKDIQLVEDHSLSYFGFFPMKSRNNGILLFLEENANFNFNKGMGISTWFKLPFRKNNLHLLKDIFGTEGVEILKIPFGNDKHITIQMVFNTKENVSFLIISLKDFQLRMRNTHNDEIIHLYVEFNGKSNSVWLNGTKMEIPLGGAFSLTKLNKMQFFNNFFGEVYSIVLYANPCEITAPGELSQENLSSFNDYYESFFNKTTEMKKKPCLVYFPYGKGENLCKNYANDMDYMLCFPKRGSIIHNYYSHKDTVNRFFGINALLPLFEYLYSHNQLEDITDLICFFFETVQLFSLEKRSFRMENLNKDFFFVVSMFLEKMPNSYFTELFGKKLFNILYTFSIYNEEFCIDYANHIFLNENILRKYGPDFIPWTFLNVMKQSSENITMDLLSIKHMVRALFYYDTNCYSEICCIEHWSALASKANCGVEVMKPCLNDRIKTLTLLIMSKLRRKPVTQKETSEFNEFSLNVEQKEQVEKYQDLLFVSKAIALAHSPCLMLKLLQIMKECFLAYDQVIFLNCRLAMCSPFFEVKNKCIELLLSFIHSDNTHLEEHKIVKLLLDNYLTGLPLLSNQPELFSSEYIDKSVNDLLNCLLNWLIPLSKEVKVNLIDGSSEEVVDANKKESIQSLKEITEKIINDIISDKGLHPFIRKMTTLLMQKLNSFSSAEVNKLNLLCDKNYFRNKFICLFEYNKKEGLNYCYVNSIIIYYHLITSSLSIAEMVDQLQEILPILLSKNSLKCSQQSQSNVFYSKIVEDTLRLYIKMYHMSYCDTQHHIIDLVSVSFNYFIFIINYNKTKTNNTYEGEIDFGLFSIDKNEDESWQRFNRQVLHHFSPLWRKKQFEFSKDNLTQIFDDLVLNVSKEELSKYQADISLLIRVTHEKKGLLPLMTILSLIYINEIATANEADQMVFMLEYKQFLFYLLIMSIYDSSGANHQKSQGHFLEVLVLGLNLLDSLRSNEREKEYLKGFIQCFMRFKKLVKNAKESNLKSFICSMSNEKIEEKAIPQLLSLFIPGNSPTGAQPHMAIAIELIKEFHEKIQMKSKQFIDVFHKHIAKFITDRTAIAKDKQDELKKLQQEHINYFISEHEAFINRSFIEERKKRMRYYKIKKLLFSWNGPWSEKELFYEAFNEKDLNKPPLRKMKMKLFNHYTKSFTRPFVVPILDIEFHLPQFSLFKVMNLFQPEDQYAVPKVKLDINAIIDKVNSITSAIEEDIKDEPNTLYALYKAPDAFYIKQHSYKNDETSSEPNKETCSKLNQLRNDSNNDCTCCLVKPSHHIKGSFHLGKSSFKFKPFVNRDLYQSEHEENDIDYDGKKKTCFGAYIKAFKKDDNKTKYDIHFSSICNLFHRNYLFRDTGIELFTSEHKSYYFIFQSEETRDEVYLSLKKLLPEKVLELDFLNLNDPLLEVIHKDWVKGGKSNLSFLMLLNLGANRSFNDISQYPVFPWVITDYSSATLPSQKSDYRDLSLPIGMITLKDKPRSYERQKEYLSNFETLDYSNLTMFSPYYYGSFYSNPLYVTHYLVRLFPMSMITIEIQGDKFDDSNRLFFSIEKSFDNAITQKGDVRELVPEFYFLPEMYINQNNFNFGVLRSKELVDDVECPLWANKDPFKFVVLMRKFIEDEQVSSQLHMWVDLIFGSKQRGEGAKEAKNLFVSSGYNDNSLNIENRTESVEFYYRIAEFGLIPKQLLTNTMDSKAKRPLSIFKANVNKNSTFQLEKFAVSLAKAASSKISFIKLVALNKLLCVCSNEELLCFNLKSASFEKNSFLFGVKLLLTDSGSGITPLITNRINGYQNKDSTILVLEQGNSTIQGGFFDGSILYSTQAGAKVINSNNKSPVCFLTASKDESVILAGTESGAILYFKKLAGKQPTLAHSINPHKYSITSIFISNELNAFASTSIGSHVHIYTLPKLKKIRSFKVKGSQMVFLSESPLASIAIYSKAFGAFICYSINGHLLRKVPQEKPNDARVIKDSSFFDYLISFTSINQIFIQSFPYLDKVFLFNLGLNPGADQYIYDVEDNLKSIIIYSDEKHELLRLRDFQ